MKFCKIRDVKSPNRAHSNDAGMDFFVPNFSDEYMDLLRTNNPLTWVHKDGIEVLPGEKVVIHSGIKVKVPENHALIAFDKSGVATKQGLLLLAKVVDEPYLGEIVITMVNTFNIPTFIPYGSKIIQMVLVPVTYKTPFEISVEEYNEFSSIRGEGGFGHTGVE